MAGGCDVRFQVFGKLTSRLPPVATELPAGVLLDSSESPPELPIR